MPRPPSDKRERVLNAAVQTIYARGFHSASLADIARTADVPLGSVYYFFKAKEDLGRAVVDHQLRVYADKTAEWDQLDEPADRLVAFLGMTLANKDTLSRLGCPVATLCGELRKEGRELGAHAAQVFDRLLDWLEDQFTQLGRTEPREHAEHLLGAIEGATLLTHTFGDVSYVEREAARLTRWLREAA